MSSHKVLLIDSMASSFLTKTFRDEQKSKLKSIRINDLFTYLKEIEQLNPLYSLVELQCDQITKLFTYPQFEIPTQLTGEAISSLDEKYWRKIAKEVRIGNYPQTHFAMMKKVESLCNGIGILQAFHYENYCDCHLGGFEYSIYAFGIGGLFVLVFYSGGDW